MSANTIFLVMLVSIKPGLEEQFSAFSKKNASLLRKYNIEPFKAISTTVKGQLIGINELPQPNFIGVFKVPSMEDFMAYMADEQYKNINELRAACTRDVIGYFSQDLPLPAPLNSTSNIDERMYVIGLANFKNENTDGIEEFNRQAIHEGLFNKHGMHIELQLKPFKVATVVGESKVSTPDRIQIFFVDRPDNLKNYISDPLYKALSPIRDNSLIKYDFFGGTAMSLDI